MKTALSKVELDITKEIINISLSKAADSLSFFIKEKVLIKIQDIKVNAESLAPISKKGNIEKSYLLTTNIKGDILGKAYLVFNEKEVEKLVDNNLPESIKIDPVAKASMTDAILLEIDNIITAAVITQFANILQCKLYGDVPHLDILSQDDLNPFLNNSNTDHFNVIYFNSHFITKHLDINPEFIWLLEDKFFAEVKNIVSDEEKVNLLQKLNSI
jgi:chemotaxis protein CheY-P-specific phosphatase CheC